MFVPGIEPGPDPAHMGEHFFEAAHALTNYASQTNIFQSLSGSGVIDDSIRCVDKPFNANNSNTATKQLSELLVLELSSTL